MMSNYQDDDSDEGDAMTVNWHELFDTNAKTAKRKNQLAVAKSKAKGGFIVAGFEVKL